MQFNIPAEHKNAAGVYIIRNTVNAKVYVGSAIDFRKRFREHMRELQHGRHHSYRLQSFVKKQGIDVLSFELATLVFDKSDRLAEEQRLIDGLKAAESRHGYNISPCATSTAGIKRRAEIYTPEYREKLRLAFLGRKHTNETKAELSALKKGKPLPKWSEERKAKARASRPPQSEETRRSKAEKMKGRVFSPETIAKMSDAAKARGKPEWLHAPGLQKKAQATKRQRAINSSAQLTLL